MILIVELIIGKEFMSIKVEVVLFVGVSYVTLEFRPTNLVLLCENDSYMGADIETKCEILDVVDKEHNVRYFKNVH